MKEHIDTVELRRPRSLVGEGIRSSGFDVCLNEEFRGGGRGGSGAGALEGSRATSGAERGSGDFV